MGLLVENLCVSFYKESNILSNVTFFAEKDLCIFGDENCGKSLILRAICGLVSYSGIVLLDGKQIIQKNKNVSIVLDEPVLLKNKSVNANLKYAISVVYGRKLNKLQKQQLLYAILKEFDLECIANKKAKRLSLFQQKMLCLARSFIKNPELLLLDDLFKGLCETEILTIKQYLKKFICLKIYTTSYPALYFDLDCQFLYLKYGRVCEILSSDDLFLQTQYFKKQCFEAKIVGEKIVFLDNYICLTKSDMDKIKEDALRLDNLAVIVCEDCFKIYDAQTKDLILGKNAHKFFKID